MNPLIVLVGLTVRGLPWAIVGTAGALLGAIAVRGVRSAAVPPGIAGSPNDDDPDRPSGPVRVVSVGPQDLVAGALAGPGLALLLRPRPLGAFLGGLAAGAAAAALIPRARSPIMDVAETAWRESR